MPVPPLLSAARGSSRRECHPPQTRFLSDRTGPGRLDPEAFPPHQTLISYRRSRVSRNWGCAAQHLFSQCLLGMHFLVDNPFVFSR